MRIRATEIRPETLPDAIGCLTKKDLYEDYYMNGWYYWKFTWRKDFNLTLTFQGEFSGKMPETLVCRFKEMEKQLKRWKYLGRFNHIVLEYSYTDF